MGREDALCSDFPPSNLVRDKENSSYLLGMSCPHLKERQTGRNYCGTEGWDRGRPRGAWLFLLLSEWEDG